MAEKLPPGFEACEDQSCPQQENISTGDPLRVPGRITKCKSPCGCRFFERPSNMPDTDPWWFVYPDDQGKLIAGGTSDYRIFCVKPKGLLPQNPKGQHYSVCSTSGCKLETEKDGENKKIWCVAPKTACSQGCECVLFRLKIETPSRSTPPESKWEYVAKADEKVAFDKDYYYECICVKLEDDE